MKKDTVTILESLNEKLKKDSKVNENELDKHLFRVSLNLSEWTEFLQRKTFEYKELEIKLDEKYKELYMYYKYEVDITLDKSELKIWINADSEYNKLRTHYNDLEVIINLCERAIKILEGTSWNVKSIIEYRKFVQQ